MVGDLLDGAQETKVEVVIDLEQLGSVLHLVVDLVLEAGPAMQVKQGMESGDYVLIGLVFYHPIGVLHIVALVLGRVDQNQFVLVVVG